MCEIRPPDRLRPTRIEPQPSAAAGSVLIVQGGTRVLCTASVAADPPPWIARDGSGRPAHGWVTAEYAMLPGSTPQRKKRGGDARGTEIQRLIARVLRAAVDLRRLPGLVTCDCDVIVADGGTRTASITGAYVALVQAIERTWGPGSAAVSGQVAAVSVGIVDGRAVLDLDYDLDVRAEVDMNIAMTDTGRFVEVQGTAEKALFDRAQLDAMLDLAQQGMAELFEAQRTCLERVRQQGE